MFLVNSVSVSDTAGMAAKQETGAKEKATDCGFVSTIKSGGAYSIIGGQLSESSVVVINKVFTDISFSGFLLNPKGNLC